MGAAHAAVSSAPLRADEHPGNDTREPRGSEWLLRVRVRSGQGIPAPPAPPGTGDFLKVGPPRGTGGCSSLIPGQTLLRGVASGRLCPCPLSRSVCGFCLPGPRSTSPLRCFLTRPTRSQASKRQSRSQTRAFTSESCVCPQHHVARGSGASPTVTQRTSSLLLCSLGLIKALNGPCPHKLRGNIRSV